jgi:hypothetical protein
MASIWNARCSFSIRWSWRSRSSRVRRPKTRSPPNAPWPRPRMWWPLRASAQGADWCRSAFKFGDLRLRLGIPEAEVTDEVPIGRYIKNFGHSCGIKDGNPAEPYPFRTGLAISCTPRRRRNIRSSPACVCPSLCRSINHPTPPPIENAPSAQRSCNPRAGFWE